MLAKKNQPFVAHPKNTKQPSILEDLLTLSSVGAAMAQLFLTHAYTYA